MLIYTFIKKNSKKLKSAKVFIYRLLLDLSFFIFSKYQNGKKYMKNKIFLSIKYVTY